MASINGIQIKSLKTFRGHEGETLFHGNIYFKGKMLGFWSQDTWDGIDTFDFDVSVTDAAVADFKAAFPDTYFLKEYLDLSHLLSDLVQLTNMEKHLKKYMKKGYHAMVIVADKFKMCYIPVPLDGKDEEILLVNENVIDEAKKDMGDEHCILVFHDTGDFKKTFDKDHPVYHYMQII